MWPHLYTTRPYIYYEAIFNLAIRGFNSHVEARVYKIILVLHVCCLLCVTSQILISKLNLLIFWNTCNTMESLLMIKGRNT